MIPGTTTSRGAGTPTVYRKAALFAAAVFVGALHGAAPAAAQSAFGCSALESHSVLPSVEGKDGTFFRILPDLQSHQAMGDRSVAHIAKLSEALAARGITLVFLPVPGRAQVMAHQLPELAADLGYSPDIASTVHLEAVARLKAAGISVADPSAAMRKAALAGTQVFFPSDPRVTPQGAALMAQAVAEVLAEGPAQQLARTEFTTTSGADVTLSSTMRSSIQLACQEAVPDLRVPQLRTTGTRSDAAPAVVAVLGSDNTATPQLNLSGALSVESGLQAGVYGVAGGGAFAAISSYLTSADFQQAPPDVIVWEVPMSQSLALYGDQPMAELVAAAGGVSCSVDLALTQGNAGNEMIADLSGLDPDQDHILALDTGGAAAAQAQFHVTGADGYVRSRSIYRHPDQTLTGRFFLSLAGLEATGLSSVRITLPLAFGQTPHLRACPQEMLP